MIGDWLTLKKNKVYVCPECGHNFTPIKWLLLKKPYKCTECNQVTSDKFICIEKTIAHDIDRGTLWYKSFIDLTEDHSKILRQLLSLEKEMVDEALRAEKNPHRNEFTQGFIESTTHWADRIKQIREAL